jgi:hypothetical protein
VTDSWVITFVPSGGGPPMSNRVKSLLKIALRSLGLRATAVTIASPTAGRGTSGRASTRPRSQTGLGGAGIAAGELAGVGNE